MIVEIELLTLRHITEQDLFLKLWIMRSFDIIKRLNNSQDTETKMERFMPQVLSIGKLMFWSVFQRSKDIRFLKISLSEQDQILIDKNKLSSSAESPFGKGEVRRTGGYLVTNIPVSLYKRKGTVCGGRFYLTLFSLLRGNVRRTEGFQFSNKRILPHKKYPTLFLL